MKVLIIEDTIKLADNLKSYFEIAGHTSDVSYSLNDAYDYYQTSHYDIILLGNNVAHCHIYYLMIMTIHLLPSTILKPC